MKLTIEHIRALRMLVEREEDACATIGEKPLIRILGVGDLLRWMEEAWTLLEGWDRSDELGYDEMEALDAQTVRLLGKEDSNADA